MLLLWNTYIFKPIKVIAIFIHEVGHFLMTLLFNDKVAVFNITLNEVGHSSNITDSWFSSLLIANSGYIMSLVFAIFILRIKDSRIRKYVLGIISSVALISLLHAEKMSAAFLYIIVFSVITILVYIIDNDKIFEYFIDIIGVASITYCIYETLMKDILPGIVTNFGIFKNIAVYSKLATDSQVLYKVTGIPTIVWGSLWFFVSLIVLVFCMNVKKKRKY